MEAPPKAAAGVVFVHVSFVYHRVLSFAVNASMNQSNSLSTKQSSK